jgi:hypothetical protein
MQDVNVIFRQRPIGEGSFGNQTNYKSKTLLQIQMIYGV